MWNKFRSWYIQYQDEITWFLMGALTAFGIADFGQGHYLSAFICLFLAWGQYLFRNWRI